MKPLLDSSYFGQITTDNQVATLEAYWEGIRRSIPDAFVEPSDFVIQKSLGATTMHLVLPTVLEVIRSRNGSVLDGDEYREVLEESLTELEEFTLSGNRISGAGFWRSGSEGAAGSFSSNARRRVLAQESSSDCRQSRSCKPSKVRSKLPGAVIRHSGQFHVRTAMRDDANILAASLWRIPK